MLAAGADSIAAEAAIAEGIDVVALLPFELERYREDFTGADLERFERLYAACAERHVMPYRNEAPRETARHGPERDERYACGGAYLARNAGALIAVWDGRDPGLKGGTADIVRERLSAKPTAYFRQADFLGGTRGGPVYWIRARRAENGEASPADPAALPLECLRYRPEVPTAGQGASEAPYERLFPAGWKTADDDENGAYREAENYYALIMSSIDTFNKDALDSAGRMRQDGPSALYETADALALEFQRKARRSMRRLIVLGTAAFALMVVFDELLNYAFTLFAFFAALAGAWIFHGRTRKANADGKYYDYRSLAELARVTGQLHSVGEDIDPIELTTTKQQSLLPWVITAIRAVFIGAFSSRAPKDAENCAALLEDWVEAQRKYYEDAVAKRKKAQKPRKFLRLALFAGAVAAAFGFFIVRLLDNEPARAGLAWFDFTGIKSAEGPFPNPAAWLQALFDILLSSGAALALYMDLRAYEDEIRLFERGAVVFGRASRLMRSALETGDLEGFTDVAKNLAREAVGENFEWNDVHRSVPLEMPMG